MIMVIMGIKNRWLSKTMRSETIITKTKRMISSNKRLSFIGCTFTVFIFSAMLVITANSLINFLFNSENFPTTSEDFREIIKRPYQAILFHYPHISSGQHSDDIISSCMKFIFQFFCNIAWFIFALNNNNIFFYLLFYCRCWA